MVLAAFVLLCTGASAFAQAPDQKQLDELVRKAETGAAADDFCARTGWRPGDDVADFTVFLRAAEVGGPAHARTFSNGSCALNRVTGVHRENGGRCIDYTFYVCPKSGSCYLGKSVDCLDPAGNYISRQKG